MDNAVQMSGLQKASVLILSLGLKQSAKVFEHLTETEREILGAQIIKLKHVDSVTRQRVLDEVSEIVKTKPVTQPGEPVPVTVSAEPVQYDSGTPLKWIEAMEPGKAAVMLSSERAQNIALVIARLAPKSAADIIAQFDEKLRNEVVYRLSCVRTVSDEVIEAIDDTLRRKASEKSGEGKKRYTPSKLLESLGSVVERVHKPNFPVATKSTDGPSLPRVISSPEDLVLLSDTEIKTVLNEIRLADLVQLLKVAGEELIAAVMRNLPDDTRTSLQQELNSASQVKLGELESAQRRIVDAMKRATGASPVVAG